MCAKADHMLGGQISYKTIDSAQGVFEVTMMLERFCNSTSHPNEYSINVLQYIGGVNGIYQNNVYVASLAEREYVTMPCGSASSSCTSTNAQKIERSYYKTNIIIQNSDKECSVYFKGAIRTNSDNIQNTDANMLLYLSFIPKYKNEQAIFSEVKRYLPLKNQLARVEYASSDMESDSLSVYSSAPLIDLSYTISNPNISYSIDKAIFKTGLSASKPFYMNESQLAFQPYSIGFTPNLVQNSWLTLIKQEMRKVRIGSQDTWLRISKSNIERLIAVNDINSQFSLQAISSPQQNVNIINQNITICNLGDSSQIFFRFPIERAINLSTYNIKLGNTNITNQFTVDRIYGITIDTIQMVFKYQHSNNIDFNSKLCFNIDLCHPASGVGFDRKYELPFQVFNYRIFEKDTILSCAGNIQIPLLTYKPISISWGSINTTNNTLIINNPKDTLIIATLNQSNSLCPSTDSIYINQGSIFSTSTIGYSPSCKGYSNGSAKVYVSGTNAPFAYLWSNYSTFDSIGSLAAGKYIVTVKDKDLCPRYDTVLVNDALGISAEWKMDSAITCYGGNNGRGHIFINSSIRPYQYIWNHTTTVDSFLSNLSYGNYSGKYKYFNASNTACEQNFSFSISQPDSIYFDIIQNDNTCFGDSFGKLAIIPQGGSEGYQFYFDNVLYSSGLKINLKNGNYSVYVVDAKNCVSSTKIATILSPPKITYTLVRNDPSCIEVSNGSVLINHPTGGVSPFQYSLNQSAYTSNISYSDLPAQNYFLKVKDENGCIVSQSFYLYPQYSLNAKIDSVIDSKCPLSNSGKIYMTMSNGISPYTLSDNGASQLFYISKLSLENLQKGNHEIILTDKNQCQFKRIFEIKEPDSIQIVFNKKNESCYLKEDGKIEITSVNGGTTPYSPFSWYDASNTLIMGTDKLSPEVYTLKFDDKNKCKYTYKFDIEAKSLFKSEIGITKAITCNGSNNGELNSKITGGISPYTYLWNGDVQKNSSQYFNANAGIYILEVKDADNCIAKSTLTLTEPSAIKIDEIKVKNSDCPNSDNGIITINASGGSTPNSKFRYAIENKKDYGIYNTFTNVPKGIYLVKIKDDTECEISKEVIVETDKSLEVKLPSTIQFTLGEVMELRPIIDFGTNTSTADIKTANWNPQFGISCKDCIVTDFMPTAGGVYSVEIIYGNNCISKATSLFEVSKAEDVYIPNSFSPNNDQKNDIWYVYGKNVKTIDIKLINRVGELVFFSNDIQKGWDGLYKNKMENASPYRYLVEATYLDGTKKLYEGYLHLIR